HSTFSAFPPRKDTQLFSGVVRSANASVQVVILPYVEQGAKYSLWNLNYDVNGDGPIDATIMAMGSVNLQARSFDVPFYLCPSDLATAANLAGGLPQGRCNYMGCTGAISDWRGGLGAFSGPANGIYDGIFAMPNTVGRLMAGPTIAQVSDGTSNTAMFAEI